MRPQIRKSRGFALVDLIALVVIGVLVLAILTSVLGRVKQAARIHVCLSNLRAIGQASNAYLTEYADLPWALPSPYSVRGQRFIWPLYTEFVWGGGRPDKSSTDFQRAGGDSRLNPYGSDVYQLPPRDRPMNRFISPAVSWSDPNREFRAPARTEIPMKLPGLFKCPSDSTIEIPLVGGQNPDRGIGSPFSTWEFWGSSYPLNWLWPYYYLSAPPGNMPPYTGSNRFLRIIGAWRERGGEMVPGLGKHLLKDKGGRWASRFITFFENRANFAFAAAAPRGAHNPSPRRTTGWHGRTNYHVAGFRDGGARYMEFDTRWLNGAGWTLWPNHPWEGAWEPFDPLNP
ncbi:MAG: type II secretion system protein [Planctomycetes bacterium]|nr:type II secretion system protein [Planctomycetota bacterium]